MLSTKFIKATKDYCTYEKSVCAPYIRKAFSLDALPEKATLTLTSTGFYRLFVNGVEVTSSLLAPYITNPDDCLFYDVYDIASYLKVGKNAIGFMLGNGMSNAMGGYIWNFEKARFRSSPKLALSFESDFLSFEADDSFKTHPSPIYFDDLRSGEFYDANLEIKGWCDADFDDSAWENVIETEAPRGKTLLNNTDKIIVSKELQALEIRPCIISHEKNSFTRQISLDISEKAFYKPEKTERGFVFVFSENTACLPKLRIKGKKGQRVIIQASDYLSDDGVLGFEQINSFYPFGYCQRDIYVCRGEEIEEYVPSFTYHGARYFAVIGVEREEIDLDTLTMLVIHSDVKTRGGFSCSDGVANRLQAATRTSDLANLIYFPTDCPHREKNGWTGDAADSAEQMMLNFALEKTVAQWLIEVCAAQDERGALPGIVPTTGWGFAWGNGPSWDQVIVELPYQEYKYLGKTDMFKITSTTLFKYLHYLTTRRDSHGLVAIGLGDWCHALRNLVGPKCPQVVSDTAMCYNICSKAEILYRAIGFELQADFCRALGNSFREAFRHYLIDFSTMTVKGDCQGSQALAIGYGLFDNGEIPAAYNKLISLIHEADDHIDCGVKARVLLFPLLARHGDSDLAYKMITRTDIPAFGVWTEKFGMVSLPEGFVPEYNGEITSLNHHFMGHISTYFISNIAGININPYLDNHLYLRVAPTFVSSLNHAEAFFETEKGKIEVKWERDGEKIKLSVTSPDEVTGEIVLPEGWEFDSDNGLVDSVCTLSAVRGEFTLRKKR